MSRGIRVLGVAVAGLGGAGMATATGRNGLADLVVLGAAVVVGELIELAPSNRASLPLSFAVIIVLLRASTPGEFLLVVGAASVVAVALRPEPSGVWSRGLLLAERLAEGFAAGASYRVVIHM